MSELQKLTEAVEKGNRNEATRLVRSLLDVGMAPLDIVEKALVPAMGIVGEKFKVSQIFVPEMLIAARAMKECMAILEPLLVKAGIKPKYTAVIGTVQGDLHDIGKNLVAMMWKGANIRVIDIGINLPAAKFVEAIEQHKPELVGLSSLLTTTMPAMRDAVKVIRGTGSAVKIMIGGAPVTAEFAREIGADGYALDASNAVDTALALLKA